GSSSARPAWRRGQMRMLRVDANGIDDAVDADAAGELADQRNRILIVPRTMYRSVPQMALAVSRTMASVGCCSLGSGTSSSLMSPTSWKTTAFRLTPLVAGGPSGAPGVTSLPGRPERFARRAGGRGIAARCL